MHLSLRHILRHGAQNCIRIVYAKCKTTGYKINSRLHQVISINLNGKYGRITDNGGNDIIYSFQRK